MAVFDHLDPGQLRSVAEARHARKGRRHHRLQPSPAGFGTPLGAQRMIRHQNDVATQQLVGLVLERLGNPVGEEADAGQAGNGNDQRHQQQAQLTGAQIAPEHAKGKGKHGIGATGK